MAQEASHQPLQEVTEELAVAEADTEENPDDEVDGAVLLATAEEIQPATPLVVDNNHDSKDTTEESDDDRSIKSSVTDHTPSKKESSSAQTMKSPSPKRVPSVAGLTIPFRTIKKAMKLDPDVPIVQNEAAIMATVATELFVKTLANDSLKSAKANGRSNIRYEDIAEARSKNKAMAFLEPLMP